MLTRLLDQPRVAPVPLGGFGRGETEDSVRELMQAEERDEKTQWTPCLKSCPLSRAMGPPPLPLGGLSGGVPCTLVLPEDPVDSANRAQEGEALPEGEPCSEVAPEERVWPGAWPVGAPYLVLLVVAPDLASPQRHGQPDVPVAEAEDLLAAR